MGRALTDFTHQWYEIYHPRDGRDQVMTLERRAAFSYNLYL